MVNFKSVSCSHPIGRSSLGFVVLKRTISKAIAILNELVTHQRNIAKNIVFEEKSKLIDSMVINLSFGRVVIVGLIVAFLFSVSSQTSGIQERVSSTDEINAIVRRSSESAETSSKKIG